MTNTEKNRLIEAFMGWRLVLKSNIGWVFVNEAGYELSMTTHNNSVIGFITDWNWLMKALCKFDNLYEFWDDKEVFFIERHAEYSELCDQIDHAVTLYNIDDAVNALCEGIEWYNTTLN